MSRHRPARTVRVGLVADPEAPTDVAHGVRDLRRADGPAAGWDLDVVSDPFTTGSEEIGSALDRLAERARDQDWDVVIGLTELPLHEDGRHLLARTDPGRRTAVLSLPALGGLRVTSRAADAVGALVDAVLDPSSGEAHRVVLPRTARARLLLGMVLANRPWRLVPGLRSALVAALATGAVATINSTVWLLAGSLSWWRLVVATVVSLALVVTWIVVDGELWDRPDGDDPVARQRSRLYNASTLLTVGAGALICYVALYLVNLAWALFVLDPRVMGGYLGTSLGYGDICVLAWFVASAATVGGAVGTSLESDEAIRAATYSTREEARRGRLAGDLDEPGPDGDRRRGAPRG